MSRVLIIEDNEMNMKLVRDLLQFKGHHTLEATTAREGLKIARETVPDLVLMDIQLPDMDGVSALLQIRADAGTQKFPVLAVSASVMPDEQQRIVASGFDAYITKPINVKAFLEIIEHFVGRAIDGR